MNDAPNGALVNALVARAFAQRDAARREQLDRWIRASRPDEDAPTPAPKPAANPDELRNSHFTPGGTCLRCGHKQISTANETGLCRDCYQCVGKRKREQYREMRSTQRNAGLAPGMEAA